MRKFYYKNSVFNSFYFTNYKPWFETEPNHEPWFGLVSKNYKPYSMVWFEFEHQTAPNRTVNTPTMDHVENGSILLLLYSILLRGVGCSKLPSNVLMDAKVIKLLGTVLSTSVSSECLDGSSWLLFYLCLEAFEHPKNF